MARFDNEQWCVACQHMWSGSPTCPHCGGSSRDDDTPKATITIDNERGYPDVLRVTLWDTLNNDGIVGRVHKNELYEALKKAGLIG